MGNQEEKKKLGEMFGREVSLKKEIVLPSEGTLITTFAEQVGEELKDKKTVFFRESSDDILEIGDIKDEETNVEYIGFKVVKPERFITLIEKYITPMELKKNRMGDYNIERSLNSAIAKVSNFETDSPFIIDTVVVRLFNSSYNFKACFKHD